MRTELVGTRNYRIVERAQIQKALEEQRLQMSGAVDDESAVELGKLVGADFIVVGSVVKIGSSYTINSRMIDVKTGVVELGRNVTGNDVNLLTYMSRELISGLFGTPKPSKAPKPPKTETKREQQVSIGKPVTWDFESGDQKGWTSEGEAFQNQPTYDDNPTARRRGQPSRHQGDYWIGGFENRPRPYSPAGKIQGDGPQGTLTSEPFAISKSHISFLVGGGCDIALVRVELVVDGQVVRQATGKCHESLFRYGWQVSDLIGRSARIRLVDHSSGGWGHINFDDVRFE